MNWTQEQEAAIQTANQNILVAAGAGSGKTAVLVARILRRILGEETPPCNVDRLLIVTFTKAAAAEMRQRLYEALQKKLLDPDTKEATLKRIYLQQTLLSKAHITTIHGFCNSVVTGNSRESGIDGSFRIGDEAETELLLQEAAEEVCEAFSLKDPDMYTALMDTYGTYRSDGELVQLLKEMVRFAMAFPSPTRWLQENASRFHQVQEKDFSDTIWGKTLLRDVLLQTQALALAAEQLHQVAVHCEAVPYIETLEDDLRMFKAALEILYSPKLSWEQARGAIEGLNLDKLKTLSSKAKAQLTVESLDALEKFSDRRNDIKKKIKQLQQQYFAAEMPSPQQQAALLSQDITFLTEMAVALIHAFREKKQSRHLIDYGDLEHIALGVLSKTEADGTAVPSHVALRYRDQFDEIYIDEYQDTNLIQESILRLVSKNYGEGNPNLFMVGDIKQSVYGFRQACPDLFLDKYRSYAQADGDGCRICLYKNFRSRPAVLQTVNQIFHSVMNENTCGMEYTEAEYLNYGASYYDELSELPSHEAPNRSTQIVVVNAEGFEDGKLPEIHEVARRIEQLIAEGYPVYDSKTKRLRPVQYGDICILLRSVASSGKMYRDYLLSRDIPAFCGEKGGFFERPEVQVLLSFLQILDNPRQDVPLLSVMRNIYGFTDEHLAQIALAAPGKELCFLDRCVTYAQAQDGAVQCAVQNFLTRMEELRKQAADCRISETVWQCMHENGFFEALGRMPGGGVSQQNLLLLMNRAVRYDTDTNHGLFTFVNRLHALAKSKSSVAGAGTSGDGLDAIQIMTIHGSKGLEFPIVFLCATGGSRDRRDENKKLLMHRDIGFGPTCYDREKGLIFPSMMRRAVRQQMAADVKAEELRVLYVALTRAREKLIITGTVKKSVEQFIEECRRKCNRDNGKPLDYYILNTENYLEMMGMALCGRCSPEAYTIEGGKYTEELETCEEAPVPEPEVTFGVPSMPLYMPETSEAALANQEKDSTPPAKISVSELKRLGASWEEEFTLGGKIQKNVQNGHFTAAQIGTFLHGALQHVDYSRISRNVQEMAAYAEELLLTMADEGFIAEEERASVPVSVLVDYLTSDFATRLAKADWIRREIPFTFLVPWGALTGNEAAENAGETAVQGVMDLVAGEGEKLLLVDFKSDSVNRDFRDYSQRYRMQLAVYAEACKRAFGKLPDEVYLYYLRAGREERIVL